VTDASQVKVPEELVNIRAYVRWEEAGKPENMPPEWQQAEFDKARLDVQLEVLQGTPLNTIRRRFNIKTVEGDDAPLYEAGPHRQS